MMGANRKSEYQIIKQHISDRDYRKASEGICKLAKSTTEIVDILRLDKLWGKIPNDTNCKLNPVKVAILGDYTLDYLRSALRIGLLGIGFKPDIYIADYGTMTQEVIDPGSGLYNFNPEFVLIFCGYRDVKIYPQANDSLSQVEMLANKEISVYQEKWSILSERTNSTVIQNNFDVKIERAFGEIELKYPWSQSNYYRRLNMKLGETAPSHVSIIDIDHMASCFGKDRWFDERFYYHSKNAFALDALWNYVQAVNSMIAATKGLAKKCLVLDLDNTLWGGVIGDDGLENIKFGIGSPEGEAYLDFVNYIKLLKQRGVLLSVCSKNEEDNAIIPFLELDEFPLTLKDISCFVANWDDKVTNLHLISDRLNIGLDSLVFVDDNPAERELVRQQCKEVTVLELPEDPALYRRALDQGKFFEMISFSNEDKYRSESYVQNEHRRRVSTNFADIDEYLKSLKMTGSVDRFCERDLPRTVQLINKTNQFNLTTKRYSELEVIGIMNSENALTRTVRLKDCFGDNGLISVFIATINRYTLEIDTWVMSCRVFGRTVEYFLFDEIRRIAKEKGIQEIVGTYIPTKKNGLVQDFFAKIGFENVKQREDGSSVWRLNLVDEPNNPCYHIAGTEDL